MPRLLQRTGLALSAALCLSPAAARAQDWPSYLDMLRPDRLIQYLLQTGVMALRSQVDLRYGGISINPVTGYVSLTDIELWPLFDWDEDADCRIAAERMSIRSGGIENPDRMRLRLQISGGSAPASCLPPDMRPMLQAVRLNAIDLPRLTVDIDYQISSAEADLHVYGEVAQLAAVDLTADFSYLWFEARDGEDPMPVAFLSGAALSVENLGGWQALQPMLPPPLTDPATAPAAVEEMLSGLLAEANRDAADAEQPVPLNAAQQAFVASAASAWPAFLQDPTRLVLETGYSYDEDVYLDFAYYEGDLTALFDDLLPRLGRSAARQRAILPAALLRQGLGEDADALPADARLALGRALLKGEGAPRDRAAGMALLTPLAETGEAGAALALARAQEQADPGAAYGWALLAGAAGEAGAGALLDRLERTLPFDAVLALQSARAGAPAPAPERLASLTDIRAAAVARFS